MHPLLREVRRRVSYHRDLVAKFRPIANCRLHARMGYQPDDNELMDALPFEQQIQRRLSAAI